VAKDLGDLLSLGQTQVQVPAAYAFLQESGSSNIFSYVSGEPWDDFEGSIKHYHQALGLWAILYDQKQADLNGSLLFFGIIRRTEIAPGFGMDDLKDNIFTDGVAKFINDTEGKKTRSTIFNSVLSEFLRDQNPAKGFRYLLHNSEMFDRRLKEGLAIYLAEHSPEVLAEQARKSGLEFSEKLEKIIGGLEAKSLSIPAAVLLAVKEVAPGEGFTIVNSIIVVSAFTYALTMALVDKSQRTLLGVLQTTIATKRAELQEKGLEEDNPVLKEAFDGLTKRRKWTAIASGWMCAFSWVPLAGVLIAICLGSTSATPTPAGSSGSSGATNQAAPNPYNLSAPTPAPVKPPSTNQVAPNTNSPAKPVAP
jgi:hypothetical protein